MSTPITQVFATFLALQVGSNERGDIVITQGDNTITFPARLAADVVHAVLDAERGEI